MSVSTPLKRSRQVVSGCLSTVTKYLFVPITIINSNLAYFDHHIPSHIWCVLFITYNVIQNDILYAHSSRLPYRGIYRSKKFLGSCLLQRSSLSNVRSVQGKCFQYIIMIVGIHCLSLSYRTSMNDLLVNTVNLLIVHEVQSRMTDEPELGCHVSRLRMSRLCG